MTAHSSRTFSALALPRVQLKVKVIYESMKLLSAPQVILNATAWTPVGGAFMEAGVPHVICCRGHVFDGACKTFTKAESLLKCQQTPTSSAQALARHYIELWQQGDRRAKSKRM